MEALLKVTQLQTVFHSDHGEITAIDNISFQLKPGETLGIVGESGCGKSVSSLSIMRLLGKHGFVKQGQIEFNGTQLLEQNEEEMRRIRGNEISMIFQEPMSSLNPVFTVGHQLLEAIRLHTRLKGGEARKYAVEMLRKVGISRAEAMMDVYPHALSGGMRQRVMIAMALSCKPRILIADEPTTALDVTVQAQILDLMRVLQKEYGTAIMLITHDLGVISEMADRVIVMYAGQVVEDADVYTLFDEPAHPYTIGLLRSIPQLDGEDDRRLESIPGTVPSLTEMPEGCRFHSRCTLAKPRCMEQAPPLLDIRDGHKARCWSLQERAASRIGGGA